MAETYSPVKPAGVCSCAREVPGSSSGARCPCTTTGEASRTEAAATDRAPRRRLRWRHISYLSDFRQLFELELLTSCYDTGYDVGFRNRPDAFVSSFAPPGTGYAEISFELRSVLYSVCFLCAYAHGGGARQRSHSFDNISRGNSFSRSIMLYCIVACRGALTHIF
jgi:hypothetical protein